MKPKGPGPLCPASDLLAASLPSEWFVITPAGSGKVIILQRTGFVRVRFRWVTPSPRLCAGRRAVTRATNFQPHLVRLGLSVPGPRSSAERLSPRMWPSEQSGTMVEHVGSPATRFFVTGQTI